MGQVIQLDPIREVAREAGNLCGVYNYGRSLSRQLVRAAIRNAMTSNQPVSVIARQSVPPRWRRLGDGPTPPEAA